MKCMCAECGVKFRSRVIDQRRKDGKTFFCPNGHGQSFAEAVMRERDAQLAEEKRVATEVDSLQAIWDRQPTLGEQTRRLFWRSRR